MTLIGAGLQTHQEDEFPDDHGFCIADGMASDGVLTGFGSAASGLRPPPSAALFASLIEPLRGLEPLRGASGVPTGIGWPAGQSLRDRCCASSHLRPGGPGLRRTPAGSRTAARRLWRPHGDSNPGSHRERVVSWARLDDGDPMPSRASYRVGWAEQGNFLD